MNEMKNTMEYINSRFDQSVERICEHRYKLFKIIKSEENKEKRMPILSTSIQHTTGSQSN